MYDASLLTLFVYPDAKMLSKTSTGASVTETAQDACFEESAVDVAVIFASPTATAWTVPSLSTVATAWLSEDHSTVWAITPLTVTVAVNFSEPFGCKFKLDLLSSTFSTDGVTGATPSATKAM